jgi:hypothetical protein
MMAAYISAIKKKKRKVTGQMRFSRILFKCFLLAAVMFLLYGCPYDSEVPLTRSEDATIDAELLGKWIYRNRTTADAGMLTIAPFNEHEFLIILREDGKNGRDYYRAFVSSIDGVKFLNLQTIKPTAEKKSWTLVSYAISNGELTIRIVEDKLIKEKFSSSPALRGFVKANLKNKDLFGDDSSESIKLVKEVTSRKDDE